MFPVTAKRTFLAHAAVATLPRVATDALRWFADHSEVDHQEAGEIWPRTLGTRAVAAQLLGAKEQEIALLGPTALFMARTWTKSPISRPRPLLPATS